MKITNAEVVFYYVYPISGMYDLLYEQVGCPDADGRLQEFMHTNTIASWKTDFIPAPNNDTAYSKAWIDVADGPVYIKTPDTQGRYYTIHMMDMTSESVANLGKRLYGTQPHTFAIVLEGWPGSLPDDVIIIHVKTSIVLAFLRVLIQEGDTPQSIQNIQQQFQIIAPQHTKPRTIQKPLSMQENIPAYLRDMCRVLDETMIPTKDSEIRRQVKEASLFPQDTLSHAFDQALKAIDQGGMQFGEEHHHWRIARQGIGKYGEDYLQRSIVWHKGALANVPEESLYPSTFLDAQGNRLHGAHCYTLYFSREQRPVVSQFWSLTMYHFHNALLVQNEIERYSIGDRTAGLRYGEDGSLTIYIQHKMPQDEAKKANWLPAPEGEFYLTLRLYGPCDEAITGQWNPPAIQITD